MAADAPSRDRTPQDALERMRRVIGAIDTVLLTPLLTTDAAAAEAPTELAPADIPSNGENPTPDLNAAEVAEEAAEAEEATEAEEADQFEEAEEKPAEEMTLDAPN